METPTLYRTRRGAVVHLPACPHLADTDSSALVPVRPAEVKAEAQLRLCKDCKVVLDGAARREFGALDEALEALPMPVENRARCRELAATVRYTRIWIPSSHPYVAVGTDRRVLAYFNAGFADMQPDDAPNYTVRFPNYSGGGRGRGGRRALRRRGAASPSDRGSIAVCPVHHVALPASGVCDYCAS